VDAQVSYIQGDLKHTDLENDRYQLIILGNIVHSEGAASSRSTSKYFGPTIKSIGEKRVSEGKEPVVDEKKALSRFFCATKTWGFCSIYSGGNMDIVFCVCGLTTTSWILSSI